jgi:hypothetical protein
MHGSSLQQGDVKKLDQGKKILGQKTKQAPAKPQEPAQPERNRRPVIGVPDAIDFIGGRGSGTFDPALAGEGRTAFDASRWRPLLQQMARDPLASGPITTQLLEQLGNMNKKPRSSQVDIIDMNAAEDALAAQLGIE